MFGPVQSFDGVVMGVGFCFIDLMDCIGGAVRVVVLRGFIVAIGVGTIWVHGFGLFESDQVLFLVVGFL